MVMYEVRQYDGELIESNVRIAYSMLVPSGSSSRTAIRISKR